MTSLCDVTHGGWLCTFHQLEAWQLPSGQPVRHGQGRRYGPSITYKITPAGPSPPEPGRPPSWTSPLAFGLIVSNQVIFPRGVREKKLEKERETRFRKSKDDEVGREVEWKGRGGRGRGERR
jgi:hypothetical protein